jgi:LysM repeat protein
LATGTGVDKANLFYATQETIAASGVLNLDLSNSSTYDPLSTAVAFTKVKLIYIEVVTDPEAVAVGSGITVGGHASAAMSTFFGDTSDTIKIKQGGCFQLSCNTAAGYAVTATTADIIKIANDIPQYQGSTTIQPGQKFEVPADQSNIDVISNVAKTGDPAKATIGGETVWITHGAEGQSGADQKYLLPDQFTPLFKSTNPDFESTGNLSDSDKNAGVQAGITTDNNIWINAQGMQKYVGSDKWIACHNLENGASFGQYGGSKGAITVQTEETIFVVTSNLYIIALSVPV